MVVFVGIILIAFTCTIFTVVKNALVNVWYDAWVVFPISFGWFLALTALYFALLFLLSLSVNLSKPVKKKSNFYRWILTQTTKLILILGRVKVQTSGLDKVKDLPPFLIVANHRSNFDPFLAIASLPKAQLAYISKPAIFQIPITGKVAHKCFFLPIDRDNDRNAVATIRKAAELIKEGVVSIGIYPEGTRSKTGELLPFRNGAFKVAKWAGCPIVIAKTTGTEKIAKRFALKKTKTTFEILDVLTSQEVASMSTWDIGEYARSLMLGNSPKEERRKLENDLSRSV